MLLYMVAIGMVQVAFVEIIDVVSVLNGGMAAALAMGVRMRRVCFAWVCHGLRLLS